MRQPAPSASPIWRKALLARVSRMVESNKNHPHLHVPVPGGGRPTQLLMASGWGATRHVRLTTRVGTSSPGASAGSRPCTHPAHCAALVDALGIPTGRSSYASIPTRWALLRTARVPAPLPHATAHPGRFIWDCAIRPQAGHARWHDALAPTAVTSAYIRTLTTASSASMDSPSPTGGRTRRWPSAPPAAVTHERRPGGCTWRGAGGAGGGRRRGRRGAGGGRGSALPRPSKLQTRRTSSGRTTCRCVGSCGGAASGSRRDHWTTSCPAFCRMPAGGAPTMRRGRIAWSPPLDDALGPIVLHLSRPSKAGGVVGGERAGHHSFEPQPPSNSPCAPRRRGQSGGGAPMAGSSPPHHHYAAPMALWKARSLVPGGLGGVSGDGFEVCVDPSACCPCDARRSDRS